MYVEIIVKEIKSFVVSKQGFYMQWNHNKTNPFTTTYLVL